MTHPRLVIAGTASGVGKTTVTLAILAALRQRGRRVQPFKAGLSRTRLLAWQGATLIVRRSRVRGSCLYCSLTGSARLRYVVSSSIE